MCSVLLLLWACGAAPEPVPAPAAPLAPPAPVEPPIDATEACAADDECVASFDCCAGCCPTTTAVNLTAARQRDAVCARKDCAGPGPECAAASCVAPITTAICAEGRCVLDRRLPR